MAITLRLCKLVAKPATNMASVVFDKEWLRRCIEDGNIRFYSFDDFINTLCIAQGAYGVVFKAEAKTLGRTVAYKLIPSQNDEFENFVKEVGNYNDNVYVWILLIVYLNHTLTH